MTTGRVSTELDLADSGGRLPARPGEAYNYGAWQRATTSDSELLDQLGLCLEAMLSDLTSVSAGRSQVQNVTSWADRVRAEADLTRDAIEEMNRRYQPVIAAVAGDSHRDGFSHVVLGWMAGPRSWPAWSSNFVLWAAIGSLIYWRIQAAAILGIVAALLGLTTLLFYQDETKFSGYWLWQSSQLLFAAGAAPIYFYARRGDAPR